MYMCMQVYDNGQHQCKQYQYYTQMVMDGLLCPLGDATAVLARRYYTIYTLSMTYMFCISVTLYTCCVSTWVMQMVSYQDSCDLWHVQAVQLSNVSKQATTGVPLLVVC